MPNVTNIELFVDDVKVGEDPTSPYNIGWTPTASGTYAVRALATFDDASAVNSPTITINVAESTVPSYTPDPLLSPYMTAKGIPNNATIYFPGTPQEITGEFLWFSINEFIENLKSALSVTDLSTKLLSVYDRWGSSIDQIKYNILDPQDTDAAFRLDVLGGWTIDRLGCTGDGDKNTYMQPNITPVTHQSVDGWGFFTAIGSDNSGGVSATYQDTIMQVNDVSIDAGFEGLSLVVPGDTKDMRANINGETFTLSENQVKGNYALVTQAGSPLQSKFYKNGLLKWQSDPGTQNGVPDASYYEGTLISSNGGTVNFKGTKQTHLSLIFPTGSLTDTEITGIQSAIDTFESRVNRKTW